MVVELLESLDEEVPVSWDVGRASNDAEKRWRNGVQAWMMFDPAADYHLVIQDDALPCADLLAGVEVALEHVPGDGPVSLYMGTKRPTPTLVTQMAKQADDEGACWIGLPLLGWGVAFAAPVAAIPEMISVAGGMKRQPYDTRIGRYWRTTVKVPAWHTWPCLVDHHQGRSLVGHGGSGRHAARRHRTSALDIEWSQRHVISERVMRMKM